MLKLTLIKHKFITHFELVNGFDISVFIFDKRITKMSSKWLLRNIFEDWNLLLKLKILESGADARALKMLPNTVCK